MSQELKNIITRENKLFGKVRFTIIDGKEYAVGKDVAMALGYSNPSDAIYKKCKGICKMEIPSIGGMQTTSLIPEADIYRLIFGSKLPEAEKFQNWVFEEVLPQLRTKGVVITENATEEAIDFEKKYGTYRIRKTFTNSNNLRADWEEFKDLSKAEWKAKRLSGQDRIKLHNIIFDAISKRLQNNITELKGSEMLAMQELLTDIKSDTLKLCNNVNGGIKRGQTQEIGKLKAELESYPYIRYMYSTL